LESFEYDPETDVVVMIGEIGGPQEAEAAEFIRDHMSKPVMAYVAGLTAPKGRTMGHAGAIVTSFGDSAEEKVQILRDAGANIIVHPSEFGTAVERALAKLRRVS
ncbi:MAG: succinate--CoA ligase subunit alpha, partial [Proteobacteria bacterium]|nr:succinate--CoA ligase subunit alpha [Pseudomonadota bacterium]